MNLGTIINKANEQTGEIQNFGEILTWSMDIKFQLVPVLSRKSDNSPTHTIAARAPHGKLVSAGVAWLGEDKSHAPMWNLKFTIPELGLVDADYVAFQNEQGSFDIIVSAPKKDAA